MNKMHEAFVVDALAHAIVQGEKAKNLATRAARAVIYTATGLNPLLACGYSSKNGVVYSVTDDISWIERLRFGIPREVSKVVILGKIFPDLQPYHPDAHGEFTLWLKPGDKLTPDLEAQISGNAKHTHTHSGSDRVDHIKYK